MTIAQRNISLVEIEYRGLYKTASGKLFNADVNAALNILRKSNVVSLEALYTRGEVDTPIRIRIA